MWKAPALSVFEHGAIVAFGLLVYVMVTRIGQQRRHPSAALAWVLGIVLLPYFAVPLFLVFGTRKFARPARNGRSRMKQVEESYRVDGQAWPHELLHAMDALVELCNEARSSLSVQTYLLRNDTVGRAVVRALIEAAHRGVITRLLVDAAGSLWLPRHVESTLIAAGVSMRRFMPLFHNPLRGRTNLRNHRKLAVADGCRLWAGGRNLGDEYFLDRPGQPAWIDLSFSVDGPLAASALVQFESDWRLSGGAPSIETPAPSQKAYAVLPAQWLPSGPDRADDIVHALLLSAAWHAQERVIAVTPYFVPDEALLEAWLCACRRDVRVCLVLPQRSNHLLADWARERAVRQLVNAGAEVHLVPRMLHAKAVVVDSTLALCGSVNLDCRSLFLNYEAAAVFYSIDEIEWLACWIESASTGGQQHLGKAPGLVRDVVEGLIRAVGFQL